MNVFGSFKILSFICFAYLSDYFSRYPPCILFTVLLTSTHNLCFRAKIRKSVYPCKPQFYYIKVGCKGVLFSRTCLHDDKKYTKNITFHHISTKVQILGDFFFFIEIHTFSIPK